MNLDPASQARKIVQRLLQGDETVVWVDVPCLRLVLFSDVPKLYLGTGLVGLFLSVMGYARLDPSIGWKYQFNQEIMQNANVFCGGISALSLVAWVVFSVWIAKGEGIYAITTKRLLQLNRKKREIWVCEVRSVISVSVITNQSGDGSLCIAGADGSESLKFNYLKNVSAIAKSVAETFEIPFDEITSNPTAVTATRSRTEEMLTFLYSPVSAQKGIAAVASSISLWLAYMLFIWVWLGSSITTIGQSWQWYGMLVFFSVAVTVGMVLRLRRTARK